ncbi:MAG: hypothetical protein RLO10_02765 [Roseovarius indicus]
MKAMFIGFAAIADIGVGAHFALEESGYTVWQRTSGDSVRLD